MKLFRENIVAMRRMSRDWGIKDKKGLSSIVVLILEFNVLSRCIFDYIYYQTEGFGWSPSLLIHMIYQNPIKCVTFTLIRHIDQRWAEPLWPIWMIMNSGEGCEQMHNNVLIILPMWLM